MSFPIIRHNIKLLSHAKSVVNMIEVTPIVTLTTIWIADITKKPTSNAHIGIKSTIDFC